MYTIKNRDYQQFTKNDWEKLVNIYKSKTELAKYLNITIWSVTYFCDKHGINQKDGRSISHNKIPMPSKEELENLYQNSMSYCDIAKHYGNVSNVTVKKWFIKHNIKTRTHSETIKMIANPKAMKTNMIKYGSPYVPAIIQSKAEIEMLNWLNMDLKFDFKPTRKILTNGYELDGYDSNINAAIEYCGLYFHCELNRKNSNYHLNKLIQCRQQNIRLFTVYENEWRDRKHQIKGFISSALGLYTNTVYARDCEINIIKDNSQYGFFEDYHIQGRPQNYKFCITLSKDLKTLAAMSFSNHHRQGQEDVLVLNRLCIRPGYKIIGGSQRMFSYAPKDKKIVSWSDNRWTNGEVYERLGFIKEIEYKPSYDYVTTQGKLFSKQSMTKTKLGAGINQSEHERANELGFYKIWDCGKIKWVYT